MEHFFLFGDPSAELWAVIILGGITIICGWGYSAVNFLRFYKKRVRRFFLAGIVYLLLAPVLAVSMFLLDGWLITRRTGPLFHDNSWLGTRTGNN